MDNLTIAGGVGALVVGFIIGNVTSGGGPEFSDPGPKLGAIESQIAELAAGNKTTADAVAALNARFDANDSALKNVDSQFEGVTTQLGTIEESMGSSFTALEGAVSTQSESMQSGFEALQSGLSDVVAAAPAAVAAVSEAATETATAEAGSAVSAAAATTAAAAATAVAAVAGAATGEETTEAASEETTTAAATTEEAPTEEEAAEAAPAAESFSVGRTASLAGGEIRAYVSRVDGDAGTIDLAVNGLERMSLSAGQATGFAGTSGAACLLSAVGIADGAAQLAAACGDDRPEAVGFGPGTTASLAEGVRAFVSFGADNMARIAVNGQKTVTLPVGETTDVPGKSCAVKVEGIDRGFVSLSSDC